MHIAEGVLSAPVLAAGAAATVGGVTVGLWNTDEERIPRVAVLASAFFVGSLIHVPVGPSSAHLLLVGLTGLILGWAAFPALLVALLLQAVLFGYGGFTTLGINTFAMAFPAVICYYLFNAGIRRTGRPVAGLLAFLCGGLGVALACLFTAVALVATGRDFTAIAYATVAANAPVIIIEGFVTCSVVLFLRRVRPEVLEVPSSFLQK